VLSISIRALLACTLALAASACVLLAPFEGILSSRPWIYNLPVSAVTAQVQCELKEFLVENSYVFLDPNQSALLKLTLKTDLGGSVSYVGIDLKSIGFSGLAEIIAIQNKAPSLQVRGQMKSSSSALYELAIAQTLGERDPVFKRRPDKKKQITGLKEVNCEANRDHGLILSLRLKDWIKKFFENIQNDRTNSNAAACLNKITLKTEFQVAASIGAGINPFPGTVFILPIAGFNFDVNPALTHTLEISFTLKKFPDIATLCANIPRSTS
jgi:hypothetical protein